MWVFLYEALEHPDLATDERFETDPDRMKNRNELTVDHLARPPFREDGWESWTEAIARLAAHPNVAIKLSVGVDALSSWTAWDPVMLRPYIQHAIHAFGPGRSMIASNWPVVLLKTSYEQAWTDTLAIVEDTVADQASRTQITSGTALNWYGIQERTLA